MRILDEGRLGDSQERTVDFRNAFLITTSNIGAETVAFRGAETTASTIGGGDRGGELFLAGRRLGSGLRRPAH